MIIEKIDNKDTSIYTWPNPNFPFYYYLKHDKCRIFIIANIFHNFLWLREGRNDIKPTDYFFTLTGFFVTKYSASLAAKVLDHLKINKDQFIILCNDFRDLQNYLNSGFSNCLLVNNNAWLNENLFSVIETKKIYDAILVGRPIKCKRLYLANKVKNMALLTGHVTWGKQDDGLVLPPHVNDDSKRLNSNEMVEILNKSRCSLCLSDEEGACYSSAESLLCGVPVVSTRSLGGRDVWYNEDNSIICNDNENDVALAVEQIKSKMFDAKKIRSRQITLTNYFRDIFINKLQEIFRQNTITDIDAKKYFSENYIHKMQKSSRNEEVVAFLKNTNVKYGK